MKKYIKAISAAAMVVTGLAVTACSADVDLDGAQAMPGETQFRLNVSMAESRAASDTLKNWANGSVVYIIVDDNEKDACKFTYSASYNDWDFSKIGSIDTSFAQSGTIKAVYAQSLTGTKIDSLSLKKDILYGLSGKYTRDGKYINIDVTLDKRPMAKVRINGVPENFTRISQFQEFTTLNFATMEWKDLGMWGLNSIDAEPAAETDAPVTDYTYYGLLDSCVVDNKTTVKLVASNQKSYFSRTYDKTAVPGDYVILNGPISDEADKWSGVICEDTITLMSDTVSNIKSYVNFRSKAEYNEDVTFNALTASNLVVKGNGDATTSSHGDESDVVAKSNKADLTSNIHVKVEDMSGLVNVVWGNRTYSNKTFGYTINNLSSITPTPVELKLNTVQVLCSDGRTGKVTKVTTTDEEGVVTNGVIVKDGESYNGWLAVPDNASDIKGSTIRCTFTSRGKEYIVDFPSVIK